MMPETNNHMANDRMISGSTPFCLARTNESPTPASTANISMTP